MNIAEFKGEKTVSALATRLLAAPIRDTPPATPAEMEAALLRLNPDLRRIGELEPGTPIVVPDNFALNPTESTLPAGSLGAELLQQAESALANLRSTLKARSEEFTAQATEVQTWLKSQAAKDLAKESPELKDAFSAGANAAKAAPKEQAAALSVETKALDQGAAQVKTFRISALRTSAGIKS